MPKMFWCPSVAEHICYYAIVRISIRKSLSPRCQDNSITANIKQKCFYFKLIFSFIPATSPQALTFKYVHYFDQLQVICEELSAMKVHSVYVFPG